MGLSHDKKKINKNKHIAIKNAKQQALNEGYNQFIIKTNNSGDIEFGFTRKQPHILLFDNDVIIGEVTIYYERGIKNVKFIKGE